jgi:dihydrofolate reductase
MRRIVAGLAITLDGVTTAPSEWMTLDAEAGEIIAAGIRGADAALLGRRTYVEFSRIWPGVGSEVPMADFLNNSPKYVLSRTLTSAGWGDSRILAGDLRELVGALKAEPGGTIQVPGSPTVVRDLLAAGLLDELSMMIQPVVLGSGAHLFDGVAERFALELVESQALASGVLMVTYRPAR